MQPLVSVVVPTFRRPIFLAEALRSVLDQPEVGEVIVVDDSPEGSAAATVEALADARLRYFKMAEPSGGRPALPRNEGARLATLRYLHFLDDDDRIVAGAYGALSAALERDPGVGVAFGVVAPFGPPEAMAHEGPYFESAARRARRAMKFGNRRTLVTTMLHQATVLVNSACLIRRPLVAELGGYRPELSPVEDVDFYIRAIRRYGGAFVDRPVLHYRVGHSSLMHSAGGNERTREAYRHIASHYRATYGAVEYRALQLFARTVLANL